MLAKWDMDLDCGYKLLQLIQISILSFSAAPQEVSLLTERF